LKKKLSELDKKNWLKFIKGKEKLFNKDFSEKFSSFSNIEKTIDLHGCTLDNANKTVKKFIENCYFEGVYKITIITGKGLQSKNKQDPYQSENLGILKYSVPEYIKSDEELMCKIKEINFDDVNSSLKGSFKIFLKKYKN
tara:strand:+ start:583 stop:1002 length:420 start_codon:yes stop_codon:yes gene_type:complete